MSVEVFIAIAGITIVVILIIGIVSRGNLGSAPSAKPTCHHKWELKPSKNDGAIASSLCYLVPEMAEVCVRCEIIRPIDRDFARWVRDLWQKNGCRRMTPKEIIPFLPALMELFIKENPRKKVIQNDPDNLAKIIASDTWI